MAREARVVFVALPGLGVLEAGRLGAIQGLRALEAVGLGGLGWLGRLGWLGWLGTKEGGLRGITFG